MYSVNLLVSSTYIYIYIYITSLFRRPLKRQGLHQEKWSRDKNGYIYIYIYIYNINKLNIYLAGFLETLSANGPFPSNSFFSVKNYLQIATIKTAKTATIVSSLLLFPLLILSFSPFLFFRYWLKKPSFWRLFTQTAANLVRLVFKKSTWYKDVRIDNRC